MSPFETLTLMPFQPPPASTTQSRNVRSWQGLSSVSTAVGAVPPRKVQWSKTTPKLPAGTS